MPTPRNSSTSTLSTLCRATRLGAPSPPWPSFSSAPPASMASRRSTLPVTTVDFEKAAVTENRVWSKPFCDLIHFERDLPKKRRPDPKILVVAPMSGHYATLLRGTVEAFLPHAEVYITDWTDARTVPVTEGSLISTPISTISLKYFTSSAKTPMSWPSASHRFRCLPPCPSWKRAATGWRPRR